MDERIINFEANFSVLDRYGENVTNNEFITNPAIGRDEQIKELILILLTPEKSAILIGKPGIGKTAIVEGLAYRIQKNDVPDALKGYTIINIKTASLLGTMPSGESKVQKMIDELKKRDKVILFIDEIHMLIGSTDSSSLDFANIFKEGLGRGSIKVIGATTTEEYERYILRDKAFTRRFQKVEVPEPTREETIKIMMGTLPKFEKQTGRKMKYTPFIQERIMSFIVDITSEYKRIFALGSRYPDVCLTLLKQSFSYTVYDNREYMDIFDVRKAIENSKNIYPDVIKKELPRFDKEFNDIILEEKGEKPVEEWRKETTPLRYMQEDDKKENEELKKLNTIPAIIDKKTLNENKPVKAILSEKTLNKFAKIGPAAISRGFNEKFNRNNDSKNIDNLLLSSGIEVIKKENQTVNLPKNYTVTTELKPGGADKILLGGEIFNTLDEKEQTPKEIKYKSDTIFDKQVDFTGNSLIFNDIREQKENNNSTNYYSENNSMKNKNNEYLFGAPMYDDKVIKEKENSTDIFGQLMNKENIVNTLPADNNSEESNGNQDFRVKNKNNEYLFGAPMYDDKIIKEKENSTDIFGQLMNKENIVNTLPADNNSEESNGNQDFNVKNKNNEYLFGAPMYDNKIMQEKEKEIHTDIFGQLINKKNAMNPLSTSNDNSKSNSNQSINTGNKNNEYLFGAPMYDNKIMQEQDKRNATDIFGQLMNPNDNLMISKGRLIDNFIDKKTASENPGNNNDISNLKNNKWKFLQDLNLNDKDKENKKIEFQKSINNNQTFNNLELESKSTNFINFDDLNKGKISYNDINKSINIVNSNDYKKLNNIDNEKNMNLKLDETISETDNVFDDFFDD